MAIDKKIKAWLERKYADDYERSDNNKHYDNMVGFKWDLPDVWSGDDTVRKRVNIGPYVTIKQLCNIFDTMHPKIELQPRGPEDEEKAERLERWGEYFLGLSNDYGETEWTRISLKHSGIYDEICLQVESTEDLPGEPDPEFPLRVHDFHPSIVHSDLGGGAPLKVGVINNVLASDVLQWWEPYDDDKDIKSKTDELREMVEGDDGDNEQRVIYADYTDKNRRYVFYQKTSDTSLPRELEFEDDATVILDKENKRGFVPWVIVKGQSGSILEPLHKSNLWENQNFLDTAADTIVIRRLFFPLFHHTSATGKEMEVDFTNNSNGVINDGPGDNTEVMNPPALDRGVSELMDRNSAKMNSATGVQNLSSTEATNTQFATINALIELKKTELEPYKRNAEKAIVGVLKLFFKMAKSRKGSPLVAIRGAESRFGKKGAKITISPDDFDPRDIHVTCELLPNSGTDAMQRVNMYATLIKMGFHIPQSELLERLRLGAPEVLEAKYKKEQVINANLQANLAVKMGMAQLQVKAEELKLQQALTPPPMPPGSPTGNQNGQNAPTNNPPMQPGFDTASGDMNNPAMGGESPYMSNPEGTQTVMQ